MRTKLIMLSLSALITIGAVAFEAKATVAVGTQSLSAPAKSYSLIENASCSGRGLFCQAGSFAVQPHLHLCALLLSSASAGKASQTCRVKAAPYVVQAAHAERLLPRLLLGKMALAERIAKATQSAASL